MKFSSRFIAVAIIAGVASLTGVATGSVLSWQKVTDAREKGVPKTAIEELKPIIADALQHKRYDEAIKAIATKITLEGQIEGGKAEERVIRLEAEIAQAPAEMRPVMEALLAHWYWIYFQQNRWRFTQRTQTAEASGKDLTTWDLPRILSEIDKHFAAALAGERHLKGIPVGDYNELLEKGTVPDAYRPTLFDFLAHEALQFYQAGEQGAAKAEDEFEIDANTPVFGPVSEFLKWTPEAADVDSSRRKAILLYQILLAFHQGDAECSARLDADLARLGFARNQAVGLDKTLRYKEALQKYFEVNRHHELSAQARFLWAQVVAGEGEPLEARKVALAGMDAFPASRGGVNCYNLIQQLQAKSARIATERVWNAPWPTVRVTYRNVDKVFFRAVAYDFEAYLKTQKWGVGNLDENQQQNLLGRVAAKTWMAELPATKDLQERTEEVPVPQDLKPGFYFIVASHDESFGGKDNQCSYTAVWVSDLALVIRQRQAEGTMDGFVLGAYNGVPLQGANVRMFTRDRNGLYREGDSVQADDKGLFRFGKVGAGHYTSCIFLASHDGQQLAGGRQYDIYARDNSYTPQQSTVFFTDRSLYRPGQTVQYKGICSRMDKEKNDYHVLAGQLLTVLFRDPNGKEVSRAQVKCNDYGAFSGSFTAPGDRVTGRMTLQVEAGPDGSTSFSVEEYKRPKFQIELARPKDAAKLGAEVVLAGRATAYTGAAIGDAKVSWRVVREIQFPDWCWWGRFCILPGSEGSQNIAHGVLRTGADGAFTLKFKAAPDLSVPEKTEPIFSFRVYADVTDSTGETRSQSQAVQVGYTALKAAISATEWQVPDQPVEWSLSTTTLDGEPQSVEGSLKVYALKQPGTVLRAALQARDYDYRWWRLQAGGSSEPKPDPANADSWELGEVVAGQPFKTDALGSAKLVMPLQAGVYRAMLGTKDRFGKTVMARRTLQVLDVKAAKYPVRLANHFVSQKTTVEPGENFRAIWGTGYDAGRAFVELEQNGKLIRSWWTAADRTQEVIEQAITEEMRGGFSLRVTYIRENRAYLNEQVIDVPWSSKKLAVKWDHFVSKLGPAQKQTWTAVVTGADARPCVAEMVAGLYDASLDQYQPHHWIQAFSGFRHEYDQVNSAFENNLTGFTRFQPANGWRIDQKSVEWRYRSFPAELMVHVWRGRYGGGAFREMAMPSSAMMMDGAAMEASAPMLAAKGFSGDRAESQGVNRKMNQAGMRAGEDKAASGESNVPDLSKVTARKNLAETAFFFPHLISDAEGVVRMEFTMPEALTEWKFMGFVHDKELRSGFLADKVVTSKDLMVEPNPPRFVREGDSIEFTVKVSNQSAVRQVGKVRLTLADAKSLKEVNAECGIRNAEHDFSIPAKASKAFSWRIAIPDGMDFLTYKVVGATERLSDGEEGFLPVLSRRILVTESLPLPIRGAQTKTFSFARLKDSGRSKTLKSEALTVQMVSQPAWYAVMALPYLMEYPYECSEQIFNRLYANALARTIANTDPKIRRIFDRWENTPALDSPLEKNQDLKSVMLEETPWLRQAHSESQARRNVGILFNANRLDGELRQTCSKLAEMQLEDGLWPWFPGFRGDEYITLYIVTGFGRLRHLGVEDMDLAAALKALDALDAWVDRQYREILKQGDADKNHLNSTVAFYLYGRSFFLKDKPVNTTARAAVDYFLGQARKYWVPLNCRQSQGHLALALKRFGDTETPGAIMKSIKENSVSSEELGMFWRDTELSWWWYRAPIETQALMIEAFDEVAGDARAVEDCKVWLLKQKQTQDWKTTKATADAVYGLLRHGRNLLGSDALVQVALGGEPITPEKVEEGTGFYEKKFIRDEIKPALGEITVKKTDEGVSWGSVHWQYLEDMTKVTPYEGTPLRLKKALFVKEDTKKGRVLKPVKGALAVGDELVVRVELRVDRDMEYVHLKDQRGSGTEPVNVLSQSKLQDGLAYYESTRDTASHFFIHYLPKGVYVFEYSVRVQLKGKYQTGIASVQGMYAPEFNSHSESFELEVK